MQVYALLVDWSMTTHSHTDLCGIFTSREKIDQEIARLKEASGWTYDDAYTVEIIELDTPQL